MEDKVRDTLDREINKFRGDELELYGIISRGLSLTVKKGRISELTSFEGLGVGARVFERGAMGYASTNDLNEIGNCVLKASKHARFGEKIKGWNGLPPKTYEKSDEIHNIGRIKVYDKKFEEIDKREIVELGKNLISDFEERNVLLSSGNLSFSMSLEMIYNTSGLRHEEASTEIYVGVEGVAKDGGSVASAQDFECSRKFMTSLDPLSERVCKVALDSLNPMKVEKVEGVGLLSPLALYELLSYTLIPSLSLDMVIKGRSALSNKLGSTISSECLTFVDDGTLDWAMGSGMRDGEGTPSNRKCVIDKGVLKTFLSDCHTSAKVEGESTGNCVRHNYQSPPDIGVRNLVITSNDKISIEEVDRGVLVTSFIGSHTSNPVSGDFSLEVRGGYIIDRGDITGVARKLIVFGNVYEILKSVIGSMNDTRMVGEVITPTLAFDNMVFLGE
jgi:PmbA protein